MVLRLKKFDISRAVNQINEVKTEKKHGIMQQFCNFVTEIIIVVDGKIVIVLIPICTDTKHKLPNI